MISACNGLKMPIGPTRHRQAMLLQKQRDQASTRLLQTVYEAHRLSGSLVDLVFCERRPDVLSRQLKGTTMLTMHLLYLT
jgi:hypothetical protein